MDRVTSKQTYICVDVEAALIRGKQYIIEIGAIKWMPDGTTDTFTQLIQPYKFTRLNDRIQKLTGIKTEELLTAPSFKEAIYKFKKWCGEQYVFLTFGEFDRKVFEEELARNYVKRDFLYPMIDFQQKYMIDRKQKEQPSLAGLMTQLGLEAETQHRALADAESLLSIFKAVDGVRLIEQQRTNQFKLLLTSFKQREEDFNLLITVASCRVQDGHVVVTAMESIREYLPFTIKEVERVNEAGEKEVAQVTKIEPSKKVEAFLKEFVASLKGEVIVTRNGLKSMARILRMHNCTIYKTEVMTLLNILGNEDLAGRFSVGDDSLAQFEARVKRLVTKYERSIQEEFKRRALVINETTPV